MEEAASSFGLEKSAEPVKTNVTSELMPQTCTNIEHRDKTPERPESLSAAEDPLPPDTSTGNQKHMPDTKQSMTRLCRGILRHWLDLHPDTKLRLRSHLRQSPKPLEENIIVIDSSDEENEAVDRSNTKVMVISDVTGHELSKANEKSKSSTVSIKNENISKDDKGNCKSAIEIMKKKNMVNKTLLANERDAGVVRNESETVHRILMKDMTVTNDIPKHMDVEFSSETGNDGISKSVIKENNVASADKSAADVVKNQSFVQKNHSQHAVDNTHEQEISNDLSKNADKWKSKSTVQSIGEKNIDTLHFSELKLEAYVNNQSKLTQSQCKNMIKNDDVTDKDIGDGNSSKNVKGGTSKTAIDLIAKKKDVCDKRKNKRKYQSKFHQSQPKNMTASNILGLDPRDKYLRNKYIDAKYNSTVELIHKDISNCIPDVVPEYPRDANSTKHDNEKYKNTTELDKEENIGTSREEMEEGVEKTRNDLVPRNHTNNMSNYVELENFNIDDDDGKPNSVKSNEGIGKNSKHISENHNFHKTLNEKLQNICTTSSSLKSNILGETQGNKDNVVLKAHVCAELHTNANYLVTEVKNTEDHQVNDDILGHNDGDENSPSPRAIILGEHQFDKNNQSPDSNILKEIQKIDVSKILALIQIDSVDEIASITKTEIDTVASKNSNSNNCLNAGRNLDNLIKFRKQNDSKTVCIDIPKIKSYIIQRPYKPYAKNVTKGHHETAEIENSKILQDDTENCRIMKVTKTYEHYKRNKKLKQSCESNSDTSVLSPNDTVHNENHSSNSTECNDATKMKFSSENVNEDTKNRNSHNCINNQLRERQRRKSGELEVVHLVLDHNNAVNDFSDTLVNNNATNKTNLMVNNESEESANSNSENVNTILCSNYNSASARQGDSAAGVVERTSDPKLLTRPVIVIKRYTNRIWDELFTYKYSSPLRRSPSVSNDLPPSARSPIRHYKSPSPFITPRYAPAPKSVQERRWKKLRRSREVLVNEDTDERRRKKVELPDIEEVRRNNMNMLTAQVTPITQRQGDLVGAASCGDDKGASICSPAASAASPLAGGSCGAARGPAELPGTRPRPAEPPGTSPRPAEPPGTRPRPAEPPGTRPCPAEPPGTSPRPAEPPGTSPRPAEPPGTRTCPAEPPGTRPCPAEPPGTRPRPAEPPGTRPRPAEPPGTRPGPAEPPGTRPRPAEPPGTRPRPAEPPGTRPCPAEPPGTRPCPAEPSGTRPRRPRGRPAGAARTRPFTAFIAMKRKYIPAEQHVDGDSAKFSMKPRRRKRRRRLASVPPHAPSNLKEDVQPTRQLRTHNEKNTTITCVTHSKSSPPNDASSNLNVDRFENFTYLNEEPATPELTTARNERNTADRLKRVATSVLNGGVLRPAQNQRMTKNSPSVLDPSILKETVLAMHNDIVKILDERRNSSNRRLQCESVPLTEEQRQEKASTFGFKPLLFRRGSVAPSFCILNKGGGPSGDPDTAQDNLTDFSKRRESEIECLRMVEDAGNRIDSGLAKGRTSSTVLPLIKENLANVSNVQPFSELSFNICNPNVVADIKEECIEPIDNPEPEYAADDEFNPVIVNVQSLALPQLTNKNNFQTYAPMSTVQPNILTATLKRADPLSACAWTINPLRRNSSGEMQDFILNSPMDSQKATHYAPNVVDDVARLIRLPPARAYDHTKAPRAPVATATSSLSIIPLQKLMPVSPLRLNSSSQTQCFTSDSTIGSKEASQRSLKDLPKIVDVGSVVHAPLKMTCSKSDSPVNQQQATKHLSKAIDVSDIRLPSHTNEQGSGTTHVPDKSRLPVITWIRPNPWCLNSSSEALPSKQTDRTGETAFGSQSIPASSLPKITLKRAQPVYASYKSFSGETEILMSDSSMEKVPEETQDARLPRVVDVTGDLHVVQPDDRMGLHLVVSEEQSLNRGLSNISQPLE